jgi:hypothetical protein
MAYTKYSLTPADNNAAPPDGAPEGMLPSAVNDTMRDMMAQIRDVGDGIRGGTYTMTAPIITGGTITGVALTGNTFTSPVISGGSINNTPIGTTTASTGAFSTLSATGVTTVQAGTVSAPAITTTGDTNTGIFFPTADTIAFTEGGSESMRIDASGNLGVGTASPLAKVQIDNSAATYSANIRVRNGNFGNGVIGAASGILTVATDMNNLAFYTASNLGVDGTSVPTNERMRIDSSGNLLFNSGYGSVATAYGCRAWVNFNGTGTPAIRGSGNVSSITDNSTGDYTVNFTTAMPDANYSAIPQGHNPNVGVIVANFVESTRSASSAKILTFTLLGTQQDVPVIDCAFFR